MTMTCKIDGRKAVITNCDKWFDTYTDFAKNYGYPDAAADWDEDTRTPLKDGDIVTLLVSGEHDTIKSYGTLWIVEAANGERHIFSNEGLRILDKDKHDYVEVKRKARVGERVKIVDLDNGSSGGYYYRLGNVATVRRVYDSGNIDADFSGNDYVLDDGKWCVGLRDYVVLEPITPTTPQPTIAELIAITDGLTDAVAKLTRKITEMETRLNVTKTVEVSAVVSPPAVAHREPKVGDRVNIVDASATNLGYETDYFTEGMAYFVVAIDSGYSYPFKIAKAGGHGVWCSRNAFVLADEEDGAVAVPKALTRDDVIERAKADVAEITARYTGANSYVKFVINRAKKTVVALRYYCSDVDHRGIAKAAPGDVFNTHIGRAIALRRALGLPVPTEYTNAPQPLEARIGDVISTSRNPKGYTLISNWSSGELQRQRDFLGFLDDSREEVSAE